MGETPLNLLNDKLGLNKDNVGKRRHIMKRCFMTGKQCIFSSQIQSNFKTRINNGNQGGLNGTHNKTEENNDNLEVSNVDVSSENDNMRTPAQQGLINPSIFVVTPFRSNLKAFYNWSLKPYLIWDYDIYEENIQCADDVREVGYVVCEKICRKIQESDLVLAEISLKNPNVFYEIGLACGLERPIVFMQNETSEESILDNHVSIAKTLMVNDGIDNIKDHVLFYPGVNPLNVEKHKLEKHVVIPSIPKKQRNKLRITALSFDSNQSGKDFTSNDDIELNFTRLFSGAVTVAMNEIMRDIDKKSAGKEGDDTDKEESDANTKKDSLEPWEEAIHKLKDSEDDIVWREFSRVVPIEISDVIYSKGTFAEVAREVEESFCTIIDVSQSDPVAYFWLGYCHARGLNAIPVNRINTQNTYSKGKSSEGSRRLAFDIRALWYIEYKHNEPDEFKEKIREVLEYLLERDLPDRHRRAFWDRFPPEHKIRVFTGAIHSDDPNREMVGDWDVRTVSELFSYLPSIRSAETIELFNPLYSPDWAFRLAHDRDNTTDKMFIEDFRKYIKNQLTDVNAIVIASPDVNPFTEYILCKIYNVMKHENGDGKNKDRFKPFDDVSSEKEKLAFNGYILTKQIEQEIEDKNKNCVFDWNDETYVFDWNNIPRKDEDGFKDYLMKHFTCEKTVHDKPSDRKFHRVFYDVEYINPDLKKDTYRGFIPHVSTCSSESLLELYKGQHDIKGDDFYLLGHLLVARNPTKTGSDHLVVLLNGVSGPATLALAEILIGGGSHANPKKKAKSEEMLQRINEILDQPKSIGVEAIVRIKIKRSKEKKNKYYVDSREVESWEYYGDDYPKEIRID